MKAVDHRILQIIFKRCERQESKLPYCRLNSFFNQRTRLFVGYPCLYSLPSVFFLRHFHPIFVQLLLLTNKNTLITSTAALQVSLFALKIRFFYSAVTLHGQQLEFFTQAKPSKRFQLFYANVCDRG